jgi:hypothetical protein
MSEGSSNGKYSPSPAEAGPPADYLCPHCGQPVPATAVATGPFITCPHCGQEFALPASDAPEPTTAEIQEEAEAQMDAMRVHALARGRRATIRVRSWLIVATVGCIAIAGELIRKSVVALHALGRLSSRTVIFFIFAAASLLAAAWLGRRAMAITRELAKPLLDEPETPPDFSTLSDGSQHWKNLDQM